MIKSFKVFQNI